MEEYMSDFKNGKALIDDLIAVSKAKNADNEKDKDAVRNYVRKASIPQFKKNVYLKTAQYTPCECVTNQGSCECKCCGTKG